MSTATSPLSTSLIFKPSLAQRVIRRTGFRDHLFPAGKLDYWATHPRAPYSGRPSQKVLGKIQVERDDVDGWPVYQVSPRLAGSGSLAGHLLFFHGGAYVLPFPPRVPWPIIARFANSLRRSITVRCRYSREPRSAIFTSDLMARRWAIAAYASAMSSRSVVRSKT